MATQSTQTKTGKSAKSIAKASRIKYDQAYFEKADAAFSPNVEEILRERSRLKLENLSKLVEDVIKQVAIPSQEVRRVPVKSKRVIENTIDGIYSQRFGSHIPESLHTNILNTVMDIIQLSSPAIQKMPKKGELLTVELVDVGERPTNVWPKKRGILLR